LLLRSFNLEVFNRFRIYPIETLSRFNYKLGNASHKLSQKLNRSMGLGLPLLHDERTIPRFLPRNSQKQLKS
jgi:hypothetical protein